MQERNGVRLGQQVTDLDGRSLGRVTRLYQDGFVTREGLPILFRRDHLLRYEEVRGVRDGALVIARSGRDLHDLAAGGLPPSWRIPVPPSFPEAATPPEAALLRADLARGAVAPHVLPPPEMVLAHERDRDQAWPPAAPPPRAGAGRAATGAVDRPASDHQ
jgi:hypothetical protein